MAPPPLSPYSPLPPQPTVFKRVVDEDDENESIISSEEEDVLVYRDDADKERFDEEGNLEDGAGFDMASTMGRRKSRPSSRRTIILLGAILLSSLVIGSIAASGYQSPLSASRRSRKQHLTLDHIFNGTFGVKAKGVSWLKEAGDGVFSHSDSDGNIVLEDLNYGDNVTRVLLNSSLVVDDKGEKIGWNEWRLSPDSDYVMLISDKTQLWRHSSYSTIRIHHIPTSTTFSLSSSKVSYATWSHTGHTLAFVQDNDLYVMAGDQVELGEKGRIDRVTWDGSDVVFNGVPDWVYEEEVFQTDSALWFSPTSDQIVFLRSDEKDVPTFTFPVYDFNEDLSTVKPYPKDVVMKYPKPGYSNPIVSLHVFTISTYLAALEFPVKSSTNKNISVVSGPSSALNSSIFALTWPDMRDPADEVIFEVAWVSSSSLIVKESNRGADEGNGIYFDLSSRSLEINSLMLEGESSAEVVGEVVRKFGLQGEENDGGWIDMKQSITMLKTGDGYLDIVPNEDGYDHIALFSPASSSEPIWITIGDWEVSNGIDGIDYNKGVVYFRAANPSIERHVYFATLPTSEDNSLTFEPHIVPLTDTTKPGYYEVLFSPGCGFYVLNYAGPDVPWERLVKTDDDSYERLLEDNSTLNKTLSEFILPTTTRYLTVSSSGFALNALEIKPPNMDESGKTKYPVIFAPYGGPKSQSVNAKFGLGWNHYLAAELKYVIVIVDGRGTGFKGRKLRNPIRKTLGTYETEDQIVAARQWIKTKKYVDKRRVGIWGWSFGGYLTSKVLEADSGVFSLGMAVAPVTDWRFYDSIYTERYMSTPEENPEGYKVGGVNNITAFNNADFLLAHGSADDNVHFANTASLLEKLTRNQIRRFVFRMFTDSSHSISRGGAYRELHEWMTSFLREKWGAGGAKRTW